MNHSENQQPYLQALLKTLFFILPIAGSLELFFLLASLQVIFIIASFSNTDSKLAPPLSSSFPLLHKLFIIWIICSFISWVLLITSTESLAQQAAATLRQAFIIIQVLFFFRLHQLLANNEGLANQLIRNFIAGFLTIAVFHFLVLWLGPEVQNPHTWIMTPLLAGNIRDIGNIAEAVTALSFVYFLLSCRITHKLSFWLILTTSFTYLLWTGGRAAIIFTLLTQVLAVSFFIHYKRQYRPVLLAIIALFVAFILSEWFAIFNWNGIGRFALKVQEANQAAAKGTTPDISNGRIDMWLWTWQAILEKPIFGNGPYSFFFLEQRIATNFIPDQPHNLLLQVLLEWGVIGGLLFFAMLVGIAWQCLKYLPKAFRQNQQTFLAAFAALVLLTMHSLTGGSYWNYQPMLSVVLMYAIVLNTLSKARSKP